MKKSINRRQFLKSSATFTAGLGLAPAIANGINRVKEAPDMPDKEGYISLFDGESLNGWHKNGARWTVRNGEIIAEQEPPGSGNGGILLSNKTYKDFEMMIDVKPGWGCDSGVFLRSQPNGQSYQVYVDYHSEPNDGGIVGFLYGQSTGGWRTEPFRYYGIFKNDELVDLELKPFTPYEGYAENPLRYACTKEEWKKAWKLNEYNTLKIRCEGKYPIITTWINGTKICKFDAAATKSPDFDKEKMYQAVGDEGHIALQVHGTDTWWGDEVRWKNIKVKEL
ncbi:family 16 glycoside hydrolase [Rhodohalobacter sp. 614A]|uniref:family 16 glycoside hydrolase n=1 Tax=Rhodohalobacter sp. 614A TaxID=2908649 RepID=UPI001F2D8812|nr:family 16 glycoside hydrolase [Rhodohalobacter sp. 614A]